MKEEYILRRYRLYRRYCEEVDAKIVLESVHQMTYKVKDYADYIGLTKKFSKKAVCEAWAFDHIIYINKAFGIRITMLKDRLTITITKNAKYTRLQF